MDAIPWYKSPVMRALVTSLAAAALAHSPALAKALGLTTPDAVTETVHWVFDTIATAAAAIAAQRRWVSPVQPLAVSQASADAKTAAVAAPVSTAPVQPTGDSQ